MMISGLEKEVMAILERCSVIKAEFINFVAPDHVLIVHGSMNEYSYFKTSLFVSNSVVMNRDGFLNLYKFLKLARRNRGKNPKSPYFKIKGDSLSITPNSVKFDNDSDCEYEVDLNFVLMETFSPVNKRVDSLQHSSIDINKPYLKIKPTLLKEMNKEMKNAETDEGRIVNKRNLNRFYVTEGDSLVLETVEQNKFRHIRYEEDQRFYVPQRFDNHDFFIYDIDIRALNKICNIWPVENIIIIPHETFYLVEMHTEEQMVCKFHMKITSCDKIAHSS